jgi:hypothetical protein
MDPKGATDFLAAEWSAFVAAPLIFVGAVATVGTLVWLVRGWFSKQEIANWKSKCEALEQHLQLARARSDSNKKLIHEVREALRQIPAPSAIIQKAEEVENANNDIGEALRLGGRAAYEFIPAETELEERERVLRKLRELQSKSV